MLFQVVFQRLNGFVLFFRNLFDFLKGLFFGGLDLVLGGGLEAFELLVEAGNH